MDNEFIEVGCDKGRVLAVAATYPIGSILGIEYEHALADIAKSNMSKSLSREIMRDCIVFSA